MPLHKSLNLIFLTPYPHDIAPGQRFRFEQYVNTLKETGHRISIYSFLSTKAFKILYKHGKHFQKSCVILSGLLKRILHIPQLYNADYVFIFREASPIGPPVFEWIIAKVLRKKIIYDFDDAIWLTDKTNESTLEKIIRWRGKVGSICRWSYKVSCGNEYLAAYARQFNAHMVVNPTTIDTEHLHNPALYKGIPAQGRDDGSHPPLLQERGQGGEVVIGWTGSHSTLKYLQHIESVLQIIEQENEHVSFLVIADQKPALKLERVKFITWKKETEALDLLKMDIGIMPLPDDEWTKGKCGFKALQYMAMKIPCVVSPVGVNSKIVQQGVNGFLASTPEEWKLFLEKLIQDAALRNAMGDAGRKKVEEQYSVKSNTENFLNLFS